MLHVLRKHLPVLRLGQCVLNGISGLLNHLRFRYVNLIVDFDHVTAQVHG